MKVIRKRLMRWKQLETEYTAKMAALIELFKNNLTDVFPKGEDGEL
jgi:hypothetical protein